MTDPLARLATALSRSYRLERELGAGGMATVYLAQDLKNDRKVAIKLLRPDLAAALGPERFLREVKIAANLQHPHILPLHDSGEADGFLYYVMPFVDGISLREKLAREGELPIPMTPRSDSSLPTNVDDLARARRWQGISDRRHERPKLGHPVGPGVDHDDRHTSPRDVLLEGQVAIHGDQVSEPGPGHRPEKVAIAAPKPALICHGGHVKPWQRPLEPFRDALIEQHPHSGHRHPLQQEILGDVERGHRLLAADTREVGQELIKGITGLEVLEQSLDGDPGPDEDQGSAHDLGVSVEWKGSFGHGGLPAGYL